MKNATFVSPLFGLAILGMIIVDLVTEQERKWVAWLPFQKGKTREKANFEQQICPGKFFHFEDCLDRFD